MVLLINLSEQSFIINPGERIAQMVIAPVAHGEWLPVKELKELEETERGDGGFGHTGTK